WPEWLAMAFFMSLGLGLARLGVGLWGIARLRARSLPIVDRELEDTIEIVRAELSCTRRVEARELVGLSTPAMIGWRRPLLLLPGDWREWRADERRAVVVHELAHVLRGDFLSGLLAQFGLAMHFYHPLAHWLAARLRLEQELAADAWGARLSGGKPSYLATLARMALRRDSRAMTWPARAFLPSHGTFVRRIEMLRNAKHIRPGSLPIAARVLTVGALATLGLLIAGLRGPVGETSVLAQGQAGDRVAAVASAGDESFNMAFLPADTKMVLGIRPGSLLRRRDLRSLVNSLGKGPPLSRLQFVAPEDIDQVLVFWEGGSQDPAGPGGSPLIPTPSGFVLRTKKPQDWKALQREEFFSFFQEEARHDGQTYYRHTASRPWISVGIYMPDAQTLVAAREDLLPELIEDRNAPEPRRSWDEAWKKVPKGQVMLAFETRWLRRRIDQGRPGGRTAPGHPSDAMLKLETFSPLLDKAKSYAMGMSASDQKLTLDLVARAGSDQDAKPVVETLQALLTLGKNATQGLRRDVDRRLVPGGDAMEWVVQAAGSLLEKARVETSESFVHVHAESAVDLAEGIKSLVSAVTSAQVAARRSMSTNNLKQIGLAFHNYHAQNGHFPASINLGGKTKSVPYSWRVAILPYIEQQELFNAYNFDEPWDSPNNRKLIDKMPSVYSYSGPGGTPSSRTNSSYFVFSGRSTAVDTGSAQGAAGGRVGIGLPGAAGPGTGIGIGSAPPGQPGRVLAPEGPSLMQITDGSSNTILAVEAQRDIPWTKPEDIPFDPNGPLPELGGFTPDGFNALIADGSVRYIKRSIPPLVLKALITRDGGEVINSDSY
ncbi:MAG: M56 family metallopeptidase, partial [Isosphaeraceae bacterium]